MKRFAILLLGLFINISISDAQAIKPIDSTYLNNAAKFGSVVNKIKENVWPGMQIGPYCIFRLNGPAFLINHPNPPKNSSRIDNIYILNADDYSLMGATQTNINGVLTAYDDYSNKSFASVNQFYAELFHELHHTYQLNHIKNLHIDNPADLLTYPEDYRNDAIKLYENELWLNLLLDEQNNFTDNINKVFTCRNIRKQIIGSKYIDYEKSVESVEGPATYCEYQYLQQFASDPKEQAYIYNRFYYLLSEPTFGRDALRSKNLLTGMIQCLLLSKHFQNWQKEYYASGLYLYDFFISKFKPEVSGMPDLNYYKARAEYFTSLEKEKHLVNLNAFNNQVGTKITLLFNESPEFRGFDPMHAEAINDSLVLHSTLLRLEKGNNHLNSINHKTLSTTLDQIWFVKSVTFFVNENDIKLDGKRLICNNGAIDIDWSILSVNGNDNEYLIKVE